MARFEKTLDTLKAISQHTAGLGAQPSGAGGALNPKAVAEALNEYLKSEDATTRSIANRIGQAISRAIRGRGQIDFRRTT